MSEKMKTGYPSIDQPWLKYYDMDFLQRLLPQMTLLEYLKYNSAGRNEFTALAFKGRNRHLWESLDKFCLCGGTISRGERQVCANGFISINRKWVK